MIESDKWWFCLKCAFTQEVLHFVFIQHNCMENYLPGAPDCHWTEKNAALLLPALQAVCGLLRVLLRIPITKRPHRNRLAKSEIHQDWGTKSPWPGAWSNLQLLDERPSASELRSWPLHFCMQICLGVWFPLRSSKVGVIGMEQCKWLDMTCFIRYAISTCQILPEAVDFVLDLFVWSPYWCSLGFGKPSWHTLTAPHW